MKCPHCGKDAVISEVAKVNMRAYGNSVRVRSDCCGKILLVVPTTIFSAYKSVSLLQTDDWGN